VQQAIAEQDKIGWWNFLLGRVSKKFANIQQRHYLSLGSRRSGSVWVRKLVTELWQILWTMWEHRNHIQHNTLTPRKEQLLNRLRQEIREQFAQGTNGLPKRDHHYLEAKNKEWALTQDLETTTTWLAAVAHSREAKLVSSQCAAAGLARQKKFITNWLHRKPNNPAISLLQEQQTTPTTDTLPATWEGPGTQDSETGESKEVFNKAVAREGPFVSMEQLLGLDIEISDSDPSTVGYSSPSSHSSRTQLEPSTARCNPRGQDDTAISLSSGNASTSWDALSSDSSTGSCSEHSLWAPDDD